MKAKIATQGSVSHRYERLFKVVLIVAILGGLAYCAFNTLLPLAFIAYLKWTSDTNISNAEQQEVEWILAHVYPNSTMVRVDAAVSEWSAGDHANVAVLMTLESVASFDAIKNWYVQHPEGGWGGGLNENIFPQQGLEKLDNGPSGSTRYRVAYVQVVECVTDCKRSLHQIR